MKYIKTYEKILASNYIIMCYNCNWFGLGNELEVDKYGETLCPNCLSDDIIDIDFGDDFYKYRRLNKPNPNINKNDYNDAREYYMALYPEYFNANKYNL